MLALALAACTIPLSKQGLWTRSPKGVSPEATFVSEEDSGLALFGVLTITEPDHYAVLMERARRRFRCSRLSHPQLDYFIDYWLVVAFPIARVTMLCEPESESSELPPIQPTRALGDESPYRGDAGAPR